MLFSGKENVFRCLAASEFVLRKINFGVWFVQTFYGKWHPFYGKSIPMFGLVKHFTENEILFLRKINSHVWVVDHFTENNNFKHLHYLNKPVTIQKYSSTSTSKIIIKIQASALPKYICTSTKIFIHNIQIKTATSIIQVFGITPPWCTKMIPTRGIWTVQIHNLGNCILPIIQKTTYIIQWYINTSTTTKVNS